MAGRPGDGPWTAAAIPDQSGRTAVVTGSNGGLGFETARVLARRGAHVVLACRDVDRAGRAAATIRGEAGPASVSVVCLDLAHLASVHAAAGRIRAAHEHVDLLVNNAGVMDAPYQRTPDGFELTFAVNHLGHFALTGLLLDRLLAAPGSRVVTVSSIAHQRGTIDFDDLHGTRGYDRRAAYAQSKLANLLFTYELQARLEAAGADTISVAAHPGNARTALYRTSGRLERALLSPRLRLLTARLAQSPHVGALATLRAAVDPAARGGAFYGPPGRRQFTGHPARVESSDGAHDRATRHRLWDVSEEQTGVTYDALR